MHAALSIGPFSVWIISPPPPPPAPPPEACCAVISSRISAISAADAAVSRDQRSPFVSSAVAAGADRRSHRLRWSTADKGNDYPPRRPAGVRARHNAFRWPGAGPVEQKARAIEMLRAPD
jgi:hypothetical protein